MEFKVDEERLQRKAVIPEELVGYWRIGNRRYEFRANGKYYAHDRNVPYELTNSGMTLIHNGTRYNRLYGDPKGVPGVWLLEKDPTEEWNLRNDGTYTYHLPLYEYSGDYTFDQSNMNTSEIRAVLSESSGTLIFDPPYASSHSGQWSIAEPTLSIIFSSGTVEYIRVP
jgi:hypothetical protein